MQTLLFQKDLNIHINVKPPKEFKKILKNDE